MGIHGLVRANLLEFSGQFYSVLWRGERRVLVEAFSGLYGGKSNSRAIYCDMCDPCDFPVMTLFEIVEPRGTFNRM